MIQTVASVRLPVDETLRIKKNRLIPEGGVTGKEKRISIVTGIHGDELEGQYVCYEMIRRLKANPEYLEGTIDVYPALNPIGLTVADRMIPKLEKDLNRMFPGNRQGGTFDRAAAAVIQDLEGADLCIDVHASSRFVKEIPQVRICEEFAKKLIPYAKHMNVDMVWTNATETVHESTLAHSMNVKGVPTLVVEMGAGHEDKPKLRQAGSGRYFQSSF